MANPLTFYSHRRGPNPWKTVIILEELNVPYETVFLEFGKATGGVEGEDFMKKNPAGRVPLIYDPKTGPSWEFSLTESNVIATYLVDFYDKRKELTIETFPEKYLIHQWLLYQGATQGPIFQQTLIFALTMDNPDALSHFQGIVKRTLRTIDTALDGKQYLVGEKCTIADLAFVNWDNTLDAGLKGDTEAATMEQRKTLFPNWAAWHQRISGRPAVQKMLEDHEAANKSS